MLELVNVTLLDVLDRDIKCYQTEDGTIFRFKTSLPQQLLMKEKDDFSHMLISVMVPDGRIEQMTVSENRLYFNTDERKVYYVTRDPLLTVRYHRDVNWGEAITSAAISSFSSPIHPDKQAFHRLEDNDINKIYTNNSELAQGGNVAAIHRSKIIFANSGRTVDVHIIAMGPNAIVLSLPRDTGNIFCHDSSPFIYAPAKESLIVLNTDTMKPMDEVKASGLSNITIVSVRGDEITLAADQDGERFLMTARLPDGYYVERKNDPPSAGIRDRTDELSRIAKQYDAKNYVKTEDSELRDIEFPHNNEFYKAFNAKMMPAERDRDFNRVYEEIKMIPTTKKDRDVIVNRAWYENRRVTPSTKKGWDFNGAWDDEFKMSETVNDLLDKNAELERQIEQLKNGNEKSRDNFQDETAQSFRESNQKLVKDNAQLEVNNRESRQDVARANALNQEINAANDQLNEELGIMQEEDEEEEEKLNALRQRYRCLSRKEGKLLSSNGSDKKENVLEILEKTISENKKLCNSLSGRPNETRIKELIVENGQIMENVALKQ